MIEHDLCVGLCTRNVHNTIFIEPNFLYELKMFFAATFTELYTVDLHTRLTNILRVELTFAIV